MKRHPVLALRFVWLFLVFPSLLAAEEPTVRSTLQGHTKAVVCVVFSPDGKTLATASADQTVKLWDMTTGQERTVPKGYSGFAGGVAFSPDGQTLASADYGSTLKLWEASTGTERAVLKGHRGCVGPVAFSTDGKTLASAVMGSPIADPDNHTVKLWDLPSGKERAVLKGHDRFVVFLAFSPVGNTLASASEDDTLKLWRVDTGTERATFPGRIPAFSPDGKMLASVSDHSIKLWELATGKERATLPKQTKKILSVAFSSNGRTLASACEDGSITFWDRATGKERCTFRGHIKEVLSLAFSPNGKTLASASADHTVKLWGIPTPQKAEFSNSGMLTNKQMENLWARLMDEDAAQAYQAMGTLVRTPNQAVSLIQKRLPPAVVLKAEQITPWITDLGSDQFVVRQKAISELEKLGEQAAGLLRQRLADKPELEVRRRIEELLNKIDQGQLSLEAVRAIVVLELVGSPESKTVLASLAAGAKWVRLTREGQASLDRLNKRNAANP
jgi:WD40 repeat protein